MGNRVRVCQRQLCLLRQNNGAKATNDYDIEIPGGENQKLIYFQYGLPVSSGDQFNLVANTTNRNIKSATVLVSSWMDSNTPPS